MMLSRENGKAQLTEHPTTQTTLNHTWQKELLGEVRLLKKFMQGIDVYGAEIKVGGFSGYLCELLIMKYGSFAQTIGAFARYNQRVVIDIEGFYADRENELSLLFPEPLVIVDPVDKGRNVASAVQPQKLYTFIGASRAFLKKPTEDFFYPPKPKVLSAEVLKAQLGEPRLIHHVSGYWRVKCCSRRVVGATLQVKAFAADAA